MPTAAWVASATAYIRWQEADKPNATMPAPPAKFSFVGTKPLPRSAMTKKLWDYIKKNNLQDPKKRTMINADPALKAVFGGKKQVSMFEMTKLVSAHVK